MADTAVEITAGTGTNIDTRTEATNGHHRQVVVLGDPATNAGVAPVDATNGLSVTLTTALPAGTAAIGKLAANSGVDIGDVDVTSCALPTGAATSAKQDTIIGHVDGIEGLLTTIDGDTGTIATEVAGLLTDTELRATPVPVSGTVTANLSATDNAVLDAIEADTTTLAGAVSGTEMQVDVVGALPAGTNAIGKLAANSGVDIGDVTLTAGTAAIGTLLPPDIDITAHTNYAKKYYTNAGAVTDGIVWSPAAGKRWHIVSLFVNVSAAATVTFEDDKAGGDEAVLKMELAANSGTVIPFPEKYPFASGEDAADLIVTTSAGNVYIQCVGYEI